ncbi:hypothetical protein CPB86DRAFT_823136 [Serendipita vermifera]|nr:hypothetical protein CPB86DRAFT_823136 [Serendipita vermifera]
MSTLQQASIELKRVRDKEKEWCHSHDQAKDTCDQAQVTRDRAKEEYERAKEALNKAKVVHEKAKKAQETTFAEWNRWYKMRREKEKEWGEIVEQCESLQPKGEPVDPLKNMYASVKCDNCTQSQVPCSWKRLPLSFACDRCFTHHSKCAVGGKFNQERKEEWLVSGEAKEVTTNKRGRKRKHQAISE